MNKRLTKTQKAKLEKFIDTYKKMKELEHQYNTIKKEYELLKAEILDIIPENKKNPLVFKNHPIWKTHIIKTVLDLPKQMKEKLLKKYKKEISYYQVYIRG